jgi:hypothetical protein
LEIAHTAVYCIAVFGLADKYIQSAGFLAWIYGPGPILDDLMTPVAGDLFKRQLEKIKRLYGNYTRRLKLQGEPLEPQCISLQETFWQGEPLEAQCISEQGRHFSKKNLSNLNNNAFLNWMDILARRLGEPL